MSAPADVLLDVLTLKQVDRAGWVREGVRGAESVAAHSWGVAWLVLALLPPALDRDKALAYAVIHDLAEVWVGDLTPHDGVDRADKHNRERAAMADLCERLDRPDLLALWETYEAQSDAEGRFVRQLDRLDMALQARRYARDHDLDPSGFLASARTAITDPALLSLLDALTRP